MNIIRQIVARDCHVSMSNRQVIRHVISRLRGQERTFWAMSTNERKSFMQACINEHTENRQLYLDVMNGNL